ncbi:Nif3-like dinuclear metal center hexameric protein [Zongyangia hominis]|uniref:GTP cyclohydrolase 1 type 2 homolog n=1 Tax=Zongyangia hominis TaxID=2763677 RepID=A0A926IBK2_9FIRM|nr:Nif3-like dinuclear metal center hexameric protein [Zongyangia hominis]MBC8570180.1 Nif3-like dinuclear metal center hexameric protein [Zongyangia hominis]
MTKVRDIYRYIDQLAPFDRQESWDNSGLLIGDGEAVAEKAMMALDITDAVVDEAAACGAKLLISHHPVIFHPQKRVLAGDLSYRLVREGMSVICAHTNLDVAELGVNDCLAKVIGLEDLELLEETGRETFYKIAVFVPAGQGEQVRAAMARAGAGSLGEYTDCAFLSRGEGCFQPSAKASPYIGRAGELTRVEEIKIEMIVGEGELSSVVSAMQAAHPYETPAYDIFENQGVRRPYGLGRVGSLYESMGAEEFSLHVKEALDTPLIRSNRIDKRIKRVAVCGGAGGSLLGAAKAARADALITGDIKHDVWLEADRMGILLIDAGHFATENVVMPRLRGLLQTRFSGVRFLLAQNSIDPVVYTF